MVNLFRGGSSAPSIIGISKCSTWDWVLMAIFIVMCGILTVFAVHRARKEYALKVKYGKGLAQSDLHYNAKTVIKLFGVSFLAGWVAGALGVGGGSIFNPILISMGVPPMVSSATGKYMILFSRISSSIVYIVYG